MKNWTIDKNDLLLNLLLLLGLFLPHTNIAFMMLCPVLSIFLYKNRVVEENDYSHITKAICISILITIALYINLSVVVDIKSVVRAIVLVYLLFIFPFASGKIDTRCVLFALLYISASQLCYVFQLGYLISFFNEYYPYEGDIAVYGVDYLSTAYSTGANIRNGGLFHNPNQCARYVTFLFALYTITNNNTQIRKLDVGVIIVTLISLLLTGSRTGFLVFLCLLVCYFRIYMQEHNFLRKLILLSLLLLLIIKWNSLGRVTEINLEDSIAYKFSVVVRYLQQAENPLGLIFGNLSPDILAELGGDFELGIDSEYGNAIICYGVFTTFLIIWLYVRTYKSMIVKSRIMYFILVWCFSSTILFSYRMSFLWLLALSIGTTTSNATELDNNEYN